MTLAEKIELAGYNPDELIAIGSGEEREVLDKAVVGVTDSPDDPRLVYDIDRLIECLQEAHGWTYEEACDWYGYNTARSLAYVDNGPIVMRRFEDD